MFCKNQQVIIWQAIFKDYSMKSQEMIVNWINYSETSFDRLHQIEHFLVHTDG